MLQTGVESGMIQTGVDNDMLQTGVENGMLQTGVENFMIQTGVENGMLQTEVKNGMVTKSDICYKSKIYTANNHLLHFFLLLTRVDLQTSTSYKIGYIYGHLL